MCSLFCCYSAELKNFLTKNGIRYEICALNPNTNNMFWAYLRNDKLDKLLTDWSKRLRN